MGRAAKGSPSINLLATGSTVHCLHQLKQLITCTSIDAVIVVQWFIATQRLCQLQHPPNIINSSWVLEVSQSAL